jgi:predicted MFS family arabinose efflux permease
LIARRWIALAILFISFLQFTLNWFSVIPAFPAMTGELALDLPRIALVVSAFMAGYGITHIPGGLLAGAFGIRAALLLGIALETIGAGLTAAAPNYETLVLARGLCGIGGSIYIGSTLGLIGAWFRGHELVTATALVAGVAFTVGASLGLFAWVPVITGLGWRPALLIGALIGAATFVMMLVLFPQPEGEAAAGIRGGQISLDSLRRVFGSGNLWRLGLSFVGVYGSYFMAAQLLPEYAASHLGADSHAAAGLGTILLFGGIPGSFLGGWLAERRSRLMTIYLVNCVVESLAILAIPLLGLQGLQAAALIIGTSASLAFVIWISMPGLYTDTLRLADIPAAAGLLLSAAAIGGVACPGLYGRLVAAWGYPTAWAIEAVIAFLFALLCLTVRAPGTSTRAG